MKILVVDDKKENLDAAKKAFKNDVICCSSAEKALDLMEEIKFDIVLTDMIMPKPNNYHNKRLEKYFGEREKLRTLQDWEEEELSELLKDSYDACGLDVAQKAIEKKIPVVIVSFLEHHSKYEWAFQAAVAEFGRKKNSKPYMIAKGAENHMYEGVEYRFKDRIGWQSGYNPEKKFALITNYTLNTENEFKDNPENWKKILDLLIELLKENKMITNLKS